MNKFNQLHWPLIIDEWIVFLKRKRMLMKISLFHLTRTLTTLMLLGVILTACSTPPDRQPTVANDGAQLFEQWHCGDCHRDDGKGPAPSLVGIAGRSVTLSNGDTVMVDADYVRNSILDPKAQLHAGYQPIMPALAGQIGDAGVTALVDYILSLQ